MKKKRIIIILLIITILANNITYKPNEVHAVAPPIPIIYEFFTVFFGASGCGKAFGETKEVLDSKFQSFIEYVEGLKKLHAISIEVRKNFISGIVNQKIEQCTEFIALFNQWLELQRQNVLNSNITDVSNNIGYTADMYSVGGANFTIMADNAINYYDSLPSNIPYSHNMYFKNGDLKRLLGRTMYRRAVSNNIVVEINAYKVKNNRIDFDISLIMPNTNLFLGKLGYITGDYSESNNITYTDNGVYAINNSLYFNNVNKYQFAEGSEFVSQIEIYDKIFSQGHSIYDFYYNFNDMYMINNYGLNDTGLKKLPSQIHFDIVNGVDHWLFTSYYNGMYKLHQEGEIITGKGILVGYLAQLKNLYPDIFGNDVLINTSDSIPYELPSIGILPPLPQVKPISGQYSYPYMDTNIELSQWGSLTADQIYELYQTQVNYVDVVPNVLDRVIPWQDSVTIPSVLIQDGVITDAQAPSNTGVAEIPKDILDLVPRVGTIEQSLDDVMPRVGTIEQDMTNVKDRVGDLTNTVDDVATKVKEIPTSISNGIDRILAPPSKSLNLDVFKDIDLTQKFPFSLPWDLKRSVELLVSEPKCPRWEVPIHTEVITIDFSGFELWAKITRAFLTLIFLVALIIVTRRFISS